MKLINPNDVLIRKFEPKLQNRFVLSMENIPSYMIKSVNGVGFEQGEVMIHHINSYFKVKGSKVKWNDLTMSLYDPISPNGSERVMNWLRLHYDPLTGQAGYAYSDNGITPAHYKRDLSLEIIGNDFVRISTWVVEGAFIKNASFGEWNWESEDTAQSIELTLGMDRMYHVPHNNFI